MLPRAGLRSAMMSGVIRLVRPFGWPVLGLVLLVLGLVLVLSAPDTNRIVRGEVRGHGGKLSGTDCYMSVSYVVDDTTYRLDSGHADRWCGLFPGDPIPVFYVSADPNRATLTPRDDRWWFVALAGAVVLVACVRDARRRRRAAAPGSSVTAQADSP